MRSARSFLISLLIAAFTLASCSLNPEAKKKKYLERGAAYFDKGQYREANMEFENAIQIDPKFADAHYRLAQSLMKQGDWSHAYQELTRAVEFDPTQLESPARPWKHSFGRSPVSAGPRSRSNNSAGRSE